MRTFLFDKTIFGPVFSRRLGQSLGINLLPNHKKVCTFDCVYCECGWTPAQDPEIKKLPSREKVSENLRQTLIELQEKDELPDTITFAGNGEPTLHPQFAEIIEDTIALRNRFSPDCKVAVLSNATCLHRPGVFEALRKVDQSILKLDSAIEDTIRRHNRPRTSFSLQTLIRQLRDFGPGLIIQTLFVRGKYENEIIDNTSETEIQAWLKVLEELKPEEVMIYTIARGTPADELERVPENELKAIAARVEDLGIKTQVSA